MENQTGIPALHPGRGRDYSSGLDFQRRKCKQKQGRNLIEIKMRSKLRKSSRAQFPCVPLSCAQHIRIHQVRRLAVQEGEDVLHRGLVERAQPLDGGESQMRRQHGVREIAERIVRGRNGVRHVFPRASTKDFSGAMKENLSDPTSPASPFFPRLRRGDGAGARACDGGRDPSFLEPIQTYIIICRSRFLAEDGRWSSP
jgi:hypothetical protein